MRGDFTRDTRKRETRMGTRSVLLQQGRQLLEQNWNEQAGVNAARAEQAAIDTIGQQGAPREDAGFAIIPSASTFQIGTGALYAEGLRCENNEQIGYSEQVAEGILPSLVSQIPVGTKALVYLDAGTRPAIPTDDTFLDDPGLAASDTVVHELIDWTVRVAPMSGIGLSEARLIEAIDRNQPVEIAPFARTTGGLDADVQTEDEVTDPGPCELPPTAGYLDILNKLYRVEIHQSGSIGTAQFKWCDDAGIEAGIRSEGVGVAIDLPLAREAEWFPTGTIVELIDADELRACEPGQFGTITSSPGAPLEVSGIAAGELSVDRRIRRWSAMPLDVPPAGNWVVLAKGIKIRFAEGHYERGAGWTIPGRTRINDICWPPYNDPDLAVPLPGEGDVGFYHPTDGDRHYAALAIIRRAGGNYVNETDMRQVFPPLTDLTANVVRYDNSSSELDATNVQDAIDELAQRSCSECTLHVSPGANWADIFDEIPAGGNATVCFSAGNFDLKDVRAITRKGHVKLVGAGSATRIWCVGNCCALRFRDCRDIEVSDMVIGAENPSTFKAPTGHKTSAALEIGRCGRVRVERTTLVVGGRRWRQAACLRVDVPMAGRTGAGDVIVRDCDIVAGDLATGILILNAQSARIRDNRIRVRADRNRVVTHQRWTEDTMVSGWFGGLLFSNSADGFDGERPATRSEAAYNTIEFEVARIGGVWGVSHKVVEPNVWGDFAKAYRERVRGRTSTKKVRLDIRRITAGLISSFGAIRVRNLEFDGFRPAFDRLHAAIAPVIDSGIVVAGERAGDISISGNSILGALQGVRVGVDRGRRKERLRIDSIRVHDNFIRLPVMPLDKVRHGVYIGNARRAWVVDNDIARSGRENPTERESGALANHLGQIHSEGIRISGMVGTMVQIRGNSILDCVAGIAVHSSVDSGDKLRLAQGNLIENAERPWSTFGGLIKEDNNPA